MANPCQTSSLPSDAPAKSTEPRHPDDLIDEARRIAKAFGWAKTYDAEYLALAKILGCRLVTLDGPLWRRTNQLGFVVTPEELEPPAEEPTTGAA